MTDANRYTTANAVHQLSKLPKEQWNGFLSWLWDYEFYKLGIPVPDAVIYLEMHPDISYKLIKSRSEETGRATDIHENDGEFLYKSYEAALYASDRLNWTRICCYEGENPLAIKEISEQVLSSLGY